MENANFKISEGNKAKHWVFTGPNYTDEDILKFEDLKEFTTYFVYGKEIAASGLSHLQCYICGKKQITLPTLRKWFPRFSYFRVALGTPEQASAYCKKDGNFVEHGELPANGRAKGGEATKAKWNQIAALASEKKMAELKVEYPKEYICNYRSLKQIGFDEAVQPKDLDCVCGEWIWGETGVGKSYTARKENPGYFVKPLNKWWDNYKGQEVVIIEDMSPAFGQSMEYFMKIWPDCYAFPAEIKNHVTMIRPKKVIVTAQYHPSQIWQGEALKAISRRFTIRNLLTLEQRDINNIFSKKKNPPKMKKHDIQAMKKPKLFKQNAEGKIVENKNPLITPKIYNSLNEKYDRSPIKYKMTCNELLDSPMHYGSNHQFDYLSHPKDVCEFNKNKVLTQYEKEGCTEEIIIPDTESSEEDATEGSISYNLDTDTDSNSNDDSSSSEY